MSRYLSPPFTGRAVRVALALIAIAAAGAARADAARETAAPQAESPKEVVIDIPAAAASGAAPGRGEQPAPAPQRPQGASGSAVPFATQVHDAATAAALAELGLALMRHDSMVSGNAQVNAVNSPLSAASALGMVQAGAGGESAREIAMLMAPSTAGDRGFRTGLTSVLKRLERTGSSFSMANRVWIDRGVLSSVPAPYASILSERFDVDAAVLSFKNANAARLDINQWTARHTANHIAELIPAGGVTPLTKLVVTNAAHFKSNWAEPFDAKRTERKAFEVAPGVVRPVPTMIDERTVLRGTIDNVSVVELPFAGNAYSLLIGMPPKGHTLDALEKDLAGLDMASWSSQLKAGSCRLEFPKFAIGGKASSLKSALQALGVRSMFSGEADLQPMLGVGGKGVFVDDVYQSATIVIDEQGGEATAATAVTMQAKSFAPPAASCAIDRAFVFAVIQKATGAPLFVGKVADPLQAN